MTRRRARASNGCASATASAARCRRSDDHRPRAPIRLVGPGVAKVSRDYREPSQCHVVGVDDSIATYRAVVAEGPMPVIRFVVLPIVGVTAVISVAAAQKPAKPPASAAVPAGNSQPLKALQFEKSPVEIPI